MVSVNLPNIVTVGLIAIFAVAGARVALRAANVQQNWI